MAETIFSGAVAHPIYLVDASGNPITLTNALAVNASFSAASLAINDPTVTTQKMGVDASGNAHVGVWNGANQLAVDASGRLTLVPNSSMNVAQVAGTATDTNSGNKSAGTLRIVIATDQPALTNALKVDGSAVTQPVSGTFWQATQPVSGTVTANIGTTNGLALDATVAKVNVAQGAALGSNTGPLVQGSVTTAAPTYTTGNVNPLSLTTAGALRVDASATTQPISAASLPLPSGASTAAKQPALGTAGTAASDVITVQGIASMTALKVDGSGVTQPVSGTVTANAGTNLNTSALALDTSVNGVLLAQGSTTSGQKGPLILGAVTTNAPSYTTAQSSPLSLDTSGLLRASLKDTPTNTNNLNVAVNAALPAGTNVIGALSANQSVNNVQINGNTMSVDAGTSGNGTQRIIQASAATGTKTNVAGSATSVTILASNTARKGAMIYNDSTAILYLDLSGGTASTSSYSVQVPANGFFEVPGPTIYNGAITGIWGSATGNARVTEFS